MVDKLLEEDSIELDTTVAIGLAIEKATEGSSQLYLSQKPSHLCLSILNVSVNVSRETNYKLQNSSRSSLKCFKCCWNGYLSPNVILRTSSAKYVCVKDAS